MTALLAPPRDDASPGPRRRTRSRASLAGPSLLAQGEPLIWLTGGALVLSLLMIAGLLLLIFLRGVATFWPQPVELLATHDGRQYLGEITAGPQPYRPGAAAVDQLPEAQQALARQQLAEHEGLATRWLIRFENFELTGEHDRWVSDFEVASDRRPEWACVVERQEGGRFYGELAALDIAGERTAATPADAWRAFQQHHPAARSRWREERRLREYEIGAVDAKLADARLAVRQAQLDYGEYSTVDEESPLDPPQVRAAKEKYEAAKLWVDEQNAKLAERIAELASENDKYQLVFQTTSGEAAVPLANIVRAFPANQLGLFGKLGVYFSRWVEFLFAEPREANTEGGVLPAIWGTVVMTLTMSLAVTPFGVLAALYLREYAKTGWVVSAVRIAINNLAGVPSIVFGVFGFGFFCLQVGAFIDGGPRNAGVAPLPTPGWFALLFMLTAVAVGAAITGLTSLSARTAERTLAKRVLGWVSVGLWVFSSLLLVLLVTTTPFFSGFYEARLQEGPTFGKGCLLWASFTLALLTLPVVIVATEEALAAVPNSMREGSYACGAGKWQTIFRIVLPHAMPGIMTGMILAMARGAGEVAPLMLVGAVKAAPKLPMDGQFPFLHADRSFMHLGFQIFDVGFQSTNSNASQPLVFTTALLLISIVFVLNLVAIWLRARLRKAFRGGQF